MSQARAFPFAMRSTIAALMLALAVFAVQAEDTPYPTLKQARQAHAWCKLPSRTPAPRAASRAIPVAEVEPNETALQAQTLAFGSDGSSAITGDLSVETDVDFYKVTAQRGDILAFVVNSGFDSVGAITDLAGTIVVDNDDLTGLPRLYPPSSPLPLPQNPKADLNASVSLVVFTPGDYYIRIGSYQQTFKGSYVLDVRLLRPGLEVQPDNTKQTIFVDFDGASNVPVFALYGEGGTSATLSPLRLFMARWNLTATDEPVLIDKVMTIVKQKFDNLRLAALNGDRPTDNVAGHYDVEFRNSKDDPDTFGQLNVSRVIVGGTIQESGISTIGIASSIDPGNYDTADTALVLLDLLSAPAGDGDSVNSMQLAPGVQMIDAVAQAIAVVVAHEIGHFLGCFHTDNENGRAAGNTQARNGLMDAGGMGVEYRTGAGPDDIYGTADDVDPEFVTDDFDPFEGTVDTVGLRERTDFVIAMGLSTGKAAALPTLGTGGTGSFVNLVPCPGGTATLGASTSAKIGGGGPEPLPCFTQNVGGGTGPVQVTFDPSCSYVPVSTTPGQIYFYQAIWDFGDGTDPLAVPSSPTINPLVALSKVAKIYCGDQVFPVTLRIDITIFDIVLGQIVQGQSNFTTGEVHIAPINYPPSPVVLNQSSPPTGVLPYQLLLDVSTSFDEDGFIQWAAIDWGDGTPCQLVTVTPTTTTLSHTYTIPGFFQVTLSVIDNGRTPPGTVFNTTPSCDDPAAAVAFFTAAQQLLPATALDPALLDPRFNPILRQEFLTVQIAGNMFALKGAFTVEFARAASDKFDVLLQSNVQPDNIANVPVSITIGAGASAKVLTFTTDKRGNFNDSAVRYKYNNKKRQTRIKLSRSTLLAALGLTSATVINGNVDVPVQIVVNGTVLATNVRFAYNASAGEKGVGKKGVSFPIGN